MQAQDTPNRLIERQALAAQKMSAYIAGMQRSQDNLQRASAAQAMFGPSIYPERRYGGLVAAQREKPLREKRCGGILLRDVLRLQRAMCGRGSLLQRRRRAAHDACLAMIQLREAALAISLSSSPLV